MLKPYVRKFEEDNALAAIGGEAAKLSDKLLNFQADLQKTPEYQALQKNPKDQKAMMAFMNKSKEMGRDVGTPIARDVLTKIFPVLKAIPNTVIDTAIKVAGPRV